jgi:hypothetical protein
LGAPLLCKQLLFKLADADPGGVKFLLKLLDPCLQLLNGGPGSFISVADTPAVLDLASSPASLLSTAARPRSDC